MLRILISTMSNTGNGLERLSLRAAGPKDPGYHLQCALLSACAPRIVDLTLNDISCEALVAYHADVSSSLRLPKLKRLNLQGLPFCQSNGSISTLLASLKGLTSLVIKREISSYYGLSDECLAMILSIDTSTLLSLDLYLHSFGLPASDDFGPSDQIIRIIKHYARVEHLKLYVVGALVDWKAVLVHPVKRLEIGALGYTIPSIFEILSDHTSLPHLEEVAIQKEGWYSSRVTSAMVEQALAGLKARGTIKDLAATARNLYALVQANS